MTFGIIVRDGANVPRAISGIQVRDGTNTPRDIVEGWVRASNNALKLVFALAPPMTLDIAPDEAPGFTNGSGTATTLLATATPTGGMAPYNYAWTLISHTHPSVAPFATAPTSAATRFTQTAIGPGESYSAVFRCTVTDSSPGPYSAHADIPAFWSDIS